MKNRAERLNFFLVVWLTMFSSISLWGQNPYPAGMQRDFLQIPGPGEYRAQTVSNSRFMHDKQGGETFSGAYFSPNSLIHRVTTQVSTYNAMPSDLYYTQSGFFCKREWELEKITHIPFRFRLGSLADCNAFEGKH